MKKIILKSIACMCLIGMVWSCSTENDVQMQPDTSQIQLKSSTVWSRDIGVVLADGTYQITANKKELIAEIERISAVEGDNVKILNLEIADVVAKNDPSLKGVVLFAGTGRSAIAAKTMGFQLSIQAGHISLADPFNGDAGGDAGGDGPDHISCRGCGTGCFIDHVNVDGHLVGYCLPAGCGSDCRKV